MYWVDLVPVKTLAQAYEGYNYTITNWFELGRLFLRQKFWNVAISCTLQGRVGALWGKSDLGIWLRLLIREEKSGNKLSSPPSPQYTMGQSAARILLINPLAPTSYGAFIFVWWFWRLSYLREVISKHVDFEAALSPRARRMDGVREYEDEAQEVAAFASPQSLLYHCITMLQPLHTDDPRSQNYAGQCWLTLFGPSLILWKTTMLVAYEIKKIDRT